MPDLEREIYFTADVYQQFKPEAERLFDKIVVLQKPEYPTRPRFEACLQTDVEQALVIDGDTMLLEPAAELFELLDHFDIAVAAAPQYLAPLAVKLGIFDLLPPVSIALPEWNAGVMVANITPGFRSMVRQWSDLYAISRRAGYDMDQAGFRSALAGSRLRIATLPANYNFRAHLPQAVALRVKILHAHANLAAIAESINLETGMRMYTPNPDDIRHVRPLLGALMERIVDTKD
jgi:hypothetical protein